MVTSLGLVSLSSLIALGGSLTTFADRVRRPRARRVELHRGRSHLDQPSGRLPVAGPIVRHLRDVVGAGAARRRSDRRRADQPVRMARPVRRPGDRRRARRRRRRRGSCPTDGPRERPTATIDGAVGRASRRCAERSCSGRTPLTSTAWLVVSRFGADGARRNLGLRHLRELARRCLRRVDERHRRDRDGHSVPSNWSRARRSPRSPTGSASCAAPSPGSRTLGARAGHHGRPPATRSWSASSACSCSCSASSTGS